MTMREEYLSYETVLAIHDMSLERFGGLVGVRDEALLRAALAQPFQAFGGEELYPTAAQKAARYAYGIAKNHPFVDGNKRTATGTMGAFLHANGYRFKPRHDELYKTIYAVAEGTMSYEEFVSWIEEQIAQED